MQTKKILHFTMQISKDLKGRQQLLVTRTCSSKPAENNIDIKVHFFLFYPHGFNIVFDLSWAMVS